MSQFLQKIEDLQNIPRSAWVKLPADFWDLKGKSRTGMIALLKFRNSKSGQAYLSTTHAKKEQWNIRKRETKRNIFSVLSKNGLITKTESTSFGNPVYKVNQAIDGIRIRADFWSLYNHENRYEWLFSLAWAMGYLPYHPSLRDIKEFLHIGTIPAQTLAETSKLFKRDKLGKGVLYDLKTDRHDPKTVFLKYRNFKSDRKSDPAKTPLTNGELLTVPQQAKSGDISTFNFSAKCEVREKVSEKVIFETKEICKSLNFKEKQILTYQILLEGIFKRPWSLEKFGATTRTEIAFKVAQSLVKLRTEHFPLGYEIKSPFDFIASKASKEISKPLPVAQSPKPFQYIAPNVEELPTKEYLESFGVEWRAKLLA